MRRLKSGILAVSILALLPGVLATAPAFAASAAVMGPLNSASVSSPAASHLISYDGDWAMDIAGTGDVYARLSSPAGVSLRVERVSAACRDGRQGGTVVRVRAYLNGASVALLVYSHLADVAVGEGQTIANGARLGRAATGLPRDDRCWTGPHVHFEARNDSAYACYAPLGVGAGVGAGTVIGQIGTVGATGIRQQCGSAPPSGANPIGAYDTATSPTAGMIRVTGWSFDPDSRTTPLSMHVYVGGQAGQPGVSGHAFAAAASRPDVAAVHPGVGNDHGLDQTFETAKRGSQPVCVYAINIGGGNNVLLGCKTVTIADPNPVGSYDEVTSPQPGTIRIRGWAFDPNAPTRPLAMHVYVGGEAGEPAATGHAFTAAVSRPDVAAVHPGIGNEHGLDQTFDTAARDTQRVCLYAINVDAGANVGLGCRTVTIDAPIPLPPGMEPPGSTPPTIDATTPPVISGATAVTTPPPADTATGPSVTFRASKVRRGRKLRLTVSGLRPGTRLVVQWKRRGVRAIKRSVKIKGRQLAVRSPRHRGTYTVTVRHRRQVVGKTSVKVR